MTLEQAHDAIAEKVKQMNQAPPSATLNWSAGRDFDFYIQTSNNDYISKNSDMIYAPGGESFVIPSNLADNTTFIVYSYFFGNDVPMS